VAPLFVSVIPLTALLDVKPWGHTNLLDVAYSPQAETHAVFLWIWRMSCFVDADESLSAYAVFQGEAKCSNG
jgi:hypothetical protein